MSETETPRRKFANEIERANQTDCRNGARIAEEEEGAFLMSELFIKYGENLRVVPIFHHRIAFAQLISRGLAGSWKPDVVAVELPNSIREAFSRVLRNVRQVSC